MTDRELNELLVDALDSLSWEMVYRAQQALRDRLAQPEWVGLTDEEIDAAVKSCNTVDTYKYFRAIEAKLKEKNS